MSTLSLRCRFCAKEQPQQNLMDFERDAAFRRSIVQKLSLSKELIDFSNKCLPESVCTVCYNILNTSYEFLVQIQESQVVLSRLCSNYTVKAEFDVDCIERDIKLDLVSLDDEVPASWCTYPWRCAFCNATLPSMQAVREHSQELHGTCCAFQCADCNEKTDGFEEFVDHVKMKRKELVKLCEYCNVKMESLAHRDTHIADHNCTYCGQIFTNQSSLLAHLKKYMTKPTGFLNFNMEFWEDRESNVHDRTRRDDTSTDSDAVDEATYELSKIEVTKVESWREYPCVCKYCFAQMDNINLLKIHCIKKHKRCFGMKCVDCVEDKLFTDTFEQFVQHVRMHRPYLQNICHYCNTEVADIEIHVQTHISPHQCIACSEAFPSGRDLRRHDNRLQTPLLPPPAERRRHPGPITEKELTCDICGKQLKTLDSLRTHKLTHTDRKKDYTCDRCGKAYYVKSLMQEHFKAHDNIKNETCKICNKSFITARALKKHVKTHNMEKPFQCDHCKKFFRAKSNLRSHIIVHTNVKQYVCPYCPKTFRNKSTMKTHENQHTGARPYCCEFCSKAFASWSNCDKHMKRIHGKRLAKFTMTPHGRLPVNPETGRPSEVSITSVVQEWGTNILNKPRKKIGSRNRNRKKVCESGDGK